MSHHYTPLMESAQLGHARRLKKTIVILKLSYMKHTMIPFPGNISKWPMPSAKDKGRPGHIHTLPCQAK